MKILNPIHILRNRHRIVPTLAKWGRKCGIKLFRNDHKVIALKDAHKGQRAFIIGNGPSLTVSDLEHLKNEITFASNRVFLAFEGSAWRPTYYTVSDRLVAQNNADEIRGLKVNKILTDLTRPFIGEADDIIWIHEMSRNGVAFTKMNAEDFQKPAPHFSMDLYIGADSGDTVIYSQLQLAFYMGIREVYLIGMDFHFDVKGNQVKTGIKTQADALISNGEQNHFHPDYRKKGEIWGIPRLERQYCGFLRAKLEFENNGGFVKNASRRTKLDVFERVDFDSIQFGETEDAQ